MRLFHLDEVVLFHVKVRTYLRMRVMRSQWLPRSKCGLFLVVWCLVVWSMTYILFRLQTNKELPPERPMTSLDGTFSSTFSRNRKPLSKQTSRYMNTTVIQTEMAIRRGRIKQHCEQLKLKDRSRKGPFAKEHLRLIMVNKENKIMFCLIPKIANTNFRRLFLHIKGLVDKDEMPNISGYEIYTKYAEKLLFLEQIQRKESQTLLKQYKKIIFVREPLERLLSGYRNKFHHPNAGIREEYIGHVRDFYKAYPGLLKDRGPLRTNFDQQPLTFREFLVYWTDSFDQGRFMNEHFVPTYELSNPCEIQYDYIGRYETLNKDVRIIFQTLGFDIEFPGRNDNYSESQTVDLVEQYYREIPNRLFKRTWNYLRADSILFGYSLPAWALKKLK